MSDYLIYIALGSVLITATIIIILLINNKENKNKNFFDVSKILPLFDNDNIIKVEYIRNKIVVSFNDITLFDVQELHVKGATGITIVGDKVKFYVGESSEVNENVYKAIKEFTERKWYNDIFTS